MGLTIVHKILNRPRVYIIHEYLEAKQVSKKNVLGAAFTNQASDTLCISINYIDLFHINACCRIQTVFFRYLLCRVNNMGETRYGWSQRPVKRQ